MHLLFFFALQLTFIVIRFRIKLVFRVVPCSSVFRELKTHQKEFSSWCGECFCEKRDEKVRSIDALRKVSL